MFDGTRLSLTTTAFLALFVGGTLCGTASTVWAGGSVLFS